LYQWTISDGQRTPNAAKNVTKGGDFVYVIIHYIALSIISDTKCQLQGFGIDLFIGRNRDKTSGSDYAAGWTTEKLSFESSDRQKIPFIKCPVRLLLLSQLLIQSVDVALSPGLQGSLLECH
jgi:hypothetical protein